MLATSSFIQEQIQLVKSNRDIWAEIDMAIEDRKAGQQYHRWLKIKSKLEEELATTAPKAETSLDPEFVTGVMLKISELDGVNAGIWNKRKEIQKLFIKVTKDQ